MFYVNDRLVMGESYLKVLAQSLNDIEGRKVGRGECRKDGR